MAEQNRILNEATNLQILHAAAAEADAVPNHSSLHGLDRVFEWSQKNINFRSLNSLAEEYGMPDVVYIDVDGFEIAVLLGASLILSTSADWFIEIHVGCGLENERGNWQGVMSFFPEDRYRLLIASDDHIQFIPFDKDSNLLKHRYYLLALSR